MVYLPAEFHADTQGHTDAWKFAHRSECAAAVNARHLVPALSYHTPLVGAVSLALEHPLGVDALPTGRN